MSDLCPNCKKLLNISDNHCMHCGWGGFNQSGDTEVDFGDPRESEELHNLVREVVNNRPYYMCKAPGDHTDVQTGFGSYTGNYSRKLDEANEKYFEDAFTRLIHQRELEAEERGYYRGVSAALGRLGMKKSSRHKHTLQLYGDQTDTGYMGVRMVCIDKKCNLVTVIADEAKHNELLLSKQKGNDNEG